MFNNDDEFQHFEFNCYLATQPYSHLIESVWFPGNLVIVILKDKRIGKATLSPRNHFSANIAIAYALKNAGIEIEIPDNIVIKR